MGYCLNTIFRSEPRRGFRSLQGIIIGIILLIPIVVYAAVTTIMSNGNWNDPTIWTDGNIADDISEDVQYNNSIGIVKILQGDIYTISNLDMRNGNTLSIKPGGSLTIGSVSNSRNLTGGNSTKIEIEGYLEIWGDVSAGNSFALNVSGSGIIHGDLIIQNLGELDIQGDLIIEGDLIGGDNTLVNLDGSLEVSQNIEVGIDSNFTGSGIFDFSGVCDGPSSFCSAGPLDDIPPVIADCPEDIVIILEETECESEANWILPNASDNVSVESFSASHIPGESMFQVGSTLVTYTALDPNGNSANCSFNITVEDNTAPVFTFCPENLTASLLGDSCESSVTWTIPIVTDPCEILLTGSHTPGDNFPLGTTQVVYNAVDLSGNMSICGFNITVVDDIAPSFIFCPNDIIVSLSENNCEQEVSWAMPELEDPCIATVTGTHSPGELFAFGSTLVTYTASDFSGNTSTCSFNVIVEDDIPPVFTDCTPEVVVAAENNSCEAVVTWTIPTATDNCNVTLSSSHDPGDLFAIGTTEVTYTAEDSQGNLNICSFNVTVVDETGPTIEHCNPEVQFSEYDPATSTIIANWDEPIAVDNCGVSSFDASHNPGSRFPKGITVVTYTAIDDYGNSSSCSFEVTNDTNLPPVIQPVDVRVQSGDVVKICLQADDPEGDELQIQTVNYSSGNGEISEIDYQQLCFYYQSNRIFSGEEIFTVQVCDNEDSLICSEAQIRIEVYTDYNIIISRVITPNGDGINDNWQIDNIDLYSENTVVIQDRWGGIVFEAKGYDNERIVWTPEALPSGTYYYNIILGNGQPAISGFLELVIR